MRPIYLVIIVLLLAAGFVLAHKVGTSSPHSSGLAPTDSSSSAPTASSSSTGSIPSIHPTPSPVSAPAPKPTGGVRGTVTIGPTCPVEKNPPDPACADKPYQTTLVVANTITGRNGGVLVETDAQGRFSKGLAPGTYTIRGTSNGTPPTLAPVTVTVATSTWTQVDLQFDSGIR